MAAAIAASFVEDLSSEDLEKGGKRAQVGEIREFGGRKFIRTSTTWKYYGEGTGAKAQQHHQTSQKNGDEQQGAQKTQAEKDKDRIEINSSYGDAVFRSKELAINHGGRFTKPENISVVALNDGRFLRANNRRAAQFEKQGMGKIIGGFMPDREQTFRPRSEQPKADSQQNDLVPKIHEKPEGEKPVYQITVNGRPYYLQRAVDMNGSTRWFHVAKDPKTGHWNNFYGSGSVNEAKSVLGDSKEEAVDNLAYRANKQTDDSVPKTEDQKSDSVELIEKSNLSESTKERVLAALPKLKTMNEDDLEKLVENPLINPALFIALCRTNSLRNDLVKKISSQLENTHTLKETETGFNGSFEYKGSVYQLNGMTLTTNMRKETSSSVSKIERVTSTGKRMSQLDHFTRLVPGKKSQTLSLIGDRKKVENLFAIV